MPEIIRVLRKVIVVRFYEQNAGLFLFIFFLMFGIVESSQLLYYQLSLITGIINAPAFLGVVCLIWLVYMFKCVVYIVSRLDLPENEFLNRIALLENKDQVVPIAVTLVLVDMPVLLYSACIVSVAIYQSCPGAAAFICVFHIVVIGGATWFIIRKINSLHISRHRVHLPIFRWKRGRPYPFFYLGHLFAQLKTVLWVTKAFSLLALVGFFQLVTDAYDVRVPLLGFLFGLAAHSLIVFEFRRFEDRYLDFERMLPLPLSKRFGHFCIVYWILLVPESAILITNGVPLLDVAGGLIFGLGFLMTLHCSLYARVPDMDRHIQRLLALFLGSFMLILCKLYAVEALCLIAASWFLFSRNFYQFEGSKG